MIAPLVLALAQVPVSPGAGARVGSAEAAAPAVEFSERERSRIRRMAAPAEPPRDPTNRVSDDPRAALLGQRLFFDPALSANGEISCATCHDPARSLSDGRPLARGLGVTRRRTPDLWNLAWREWMFWDGRADSAWAQVRWPLESDLEMGGSRVDLARRLADDPLLSVEYTKLFGPLPPVADEARFPPAAKPLPETPEDPRARAFAAMTAEDREAIDRVLANAGKAIAAYERLLVRLDSPFDRFARALERDDAQGIAAYPPAAQRGLKLFVGRAGCWRCHSGPLLSDGEFHSLGLPAADGGLEDDPGRYRGWRIVKADPFRASGPFSDDRDGEAARRVEALIGGPWNWGQFRTPSLRNVALRPPYMHRGALPDLEAVVRFYSTLEGQVLPHQHTERMLTPLELSEGEIGDLVAFLRSLTGVPPAPLPAPPAAAGGRSGQGEVGWGVPSVPGGGPAPLPPPMRRSRRRRRAHRPALSLLALPLVAAAAVAHQDDPKLLGRVAPVPGPGYRNALVGNPGANGLVAGLGGPFAASGVTLLTWLPLDDFGSGLSNGNDCWGYTSPSGREYALFGHSEGLAVVEVTDPTAPLILAQVPGPTSLWRDVKVFGDHAYVVSEGGDGIQVLDLSAVDQGLVTQVTSVTAGGTTQTHNVAIDETSGFLYRCGGQNEGLRIYDLSNPDQPTFVASWSTRYVHDAQVVTYTSGPYAGRQIAFCCSGFNGGWTSTGLDVLDVTDKQNIVPLANFLYPGANYSHQLWLSEDLQYAYLNDELDEMNTGIPTTTFVIDVSDPANPFLAGTFTNGSPAIGHNVYVRGDRLYEANYRSGLRVFDLAASATSPPEVAWFDTVAADDSPNFNGMWSCYPWFEDGIVVASDMQSGLLVLRVGDPELTFAYPQGVPGVLDPSGESVPVTIGEFAAGTLVAGSAMLHIDSGTGWQSVPLTELGGGQFEAPFPALPCGTEAAWYLTARSNDGITWTEPAGAPLDTHRSFSALAAQAVLDDDLEGAAGGWTVGAPGDGATSGVWVLADPVGTAAQPENDHTPAGTRCFVTGQGSPGGSLGAADVDGGATTLLSPVLDLSGASAVRVSYWRWFSNDEGSNPGEDVLQVDVSNDGGQSWTPVETVGPTGPEASGGWYRHAFDLESLVAPTAQVRLRFVAANLGGGSIVEAAIDDLLVEAVDCTGCGVTSFCTTSPNSFGPGAVMWAGGSTSIAAASFTLNASGAVPGQFGVFFYGAAETQVPFGDGVRCVGAGGAGLFRLNPPALADAFGDLSRPLDFGAPPAGAGPGAIAAGSTWKFQCWYRDPAAGGAGFNLSDALSVTFCP